MKDKIKKYQLDWEVDSAGTGSWHAGELPDVRSIDTARKYGIDITDQRARQFKTADFDHFDQIFVMDRANRRDVLRLAPSTAHGAKVDLMLNQSSPGEDREVPDPYYDDDGFDLVFRMVDEACEQFVRQHV